MTFKYSGNSGIGAHQSYTAHCLWCAFLCQCNSWSAKVDLALLSTALREGRLTSECLCSYHTLVCSPQGKEAEENGFNYNNLRLVTADLFAAGSDTTSATLRWAFLYMLLHPETQSK